MVTARTVALLGFVISLLWEDDEGNQAIATWPRHTARSRGPWLALTCNKSGTAIYLLPWKETGKGRNVKGHAMPNGKDGEKKRFELWSEFEATDAYGIVVKKDTLFRIGRPLRIEYDSDKWTGRNTIYFHNFKKRGCKLYTNKGEAESFGILQERGEKIVSSRGIIG